MSSVLAATLVAPRELEVKDYPFPEELEPGAVLLRMVASGICGTDKHTYRGEMGQYAGAETERVTPFPIIQGHENVGIVEAIGDGGAYAHDGVPLEPGDRVVPAPNRACGHCHMCQRGFPYYLCRNLDNYGNSLTCTAAPHLFGGWSQYLYLKPGTAVFRVPESLPSEVAVLTEIFAVTHSLDRATSVQSPSGFRAGDSVAVIGVGALGQAHAIKAAMMGAGQVFTIDESPLRNELAARLAGGTAVPAGPDAVAAVRELAGGEGVDLVVNATGFPGSFGPAVEMLRDGGTLIEVGAFVDMGDESFNPAVLCGRNLTMLGIGGEDLLAYENTISLLDRFNGDIPFADMVSHRFPVADAPAAMQTALDSERSAKVLITEELLASDD
jgi:L-iditol 2-dehydrogenase